MTPIQALVKGQDSKKETHHLRNALIGGAVALGVRGAGKYASRTLLTNSLHATGELMGGLQHMQGGSMYTNNRAVQSGKQILRNTNQIPKHIKDFVTRPTAEGKTPTHKEIRRDLLRANLTRRERLITTDMQGKVTNRSTGTATNVRPSKNGEKRLLQDLKTQTPIKSYHSHPFDSGPSVPDRNFANQFSAASSHHIYTHSQTADGRYQTRPLAYGSVEGDERIGRAVQKSDTPIQRLIKTTYLGSMQDKDYVGDAKAGGLAGAAGYLIARKKGLHRWPSKLAGVAAMGTVLALKHSWHNKIVDRSVPHYDQT